MPVNMRVVDTDLRKFRGELRRLGVHRDLQKANKKAAEVVVPVARRKAAGSWGNLAGGVSRLGSRGVASIKANATQTKAYVVAGGARVPYYGGVDWGSSGRYRQFGPRSSEGRIIYPAIAEAAPKVIETYVDELDDLVSRAFPRGSL